MNCRRLKSTGKEIAIYEEIEFHEERENHKEIES